MRNNFFDYYTLFPLAFAPTLNEEDSFTRKGDYAIKGLKGLVISVDPARITWIKMGWPGSVHDNQVWSNSGIYLSRDNYFNHKEYLLGDSAFSTSSVMVPVIKKGHNANLSEEKVLNTKLDKFRIKIEHCIGLLKVQFKHLRVHQLVIHKKKDLGAILRPTMYACILHNLLIENPVPPDWFDNNVLELDEEDELNQPVNHSDAETSVDS